MQGNEIEITAQLDAALWTSRSLPYQPLPAKLAVPHKLLQIAIWRAVQTQTVTEGAPVLEFDCNEVLETSKFRHTKGWNPAHRSI